ncbi:MAG: MBL fold metallo-hydrolase [Oscillospiraceae bacterium]
MDINVYASGSGGNCYRLSDGKTKILLECGIPCIQIMKKIRFEIRQIAGVLLTHNHMDHAKAAKDIAGYGINIYSSAGTFKALNASGNRFRIVKSHKAFTVGTFDIYPFDVEHDVPEPLGYVITSNITGERLLFFTDTYYIKYVFPNINIIMGEVNYSIETISNDINQSRINRLYESHMSLEHFKEFLNANDLSKLQKIYMLHLSDDNSDENMFKKEIQKLTGVPVIVC